MRISVLGAGRVGHVIATDLARNEEFSVTAVDASAAALARLQGVRGVTAVVADLTRPDEVRRVCADADLVVGAVPGHMGFATLREVIGSGRPAVDISFFPEDPFELHAAAEAQGVAAIVDCGVAPGCSNLLAGHACATFDRVDDFTCLVGGLPVARTWPWEYRAVFSPADVIEEYTRPARFRVAGREVVKPALTDPELVEFPGVGTLEAFNTDGLRTLLATLPVPNMVEKTMRYPGHIDRIRLLREAGFLSPIPIDFPGGRVSPIEMTSALLFPAWQLGPDDEDITVMRVIVSGVEQGVPVRVQWDLLDRFDRQARVTSMARTTGFACTAAVRAWAAGLVRSTGIIPPEHLGRDARCCDFIFADLARHGVTFLKTCELSSQL